LKALSEIQLDRDIKVSIRYSKRSKRLKIVVSSEGAEAVAPPGFPERQIREFAWEKRRWIRRKLTEILERAAEAVDWWPDELADGTPIRFRGVEYILHLKDGSENSLKVAKEREFTVTSSKELNPLELRTLLDIWLVDRLKEDVTELLKLYNPILDVNPNGFRIGRARTRWGSCGKAGRIMINRKLIAFPPEILEYVVVHELCHLRIRNHSRTFWDLVGSILPDYKQRKYFLHQNHL
jgi:predicted metal-dependent hydrolase